MPLPDETWRKWDARLSQWATEGHVGAPVSSAYRGPTGGRATASPPIPKGLRNHETSALLADLKRAAPHAFRALVLWVEGRGTRGAQAASLSVHVNTYRTRVEQAYAWLEVASRAKPKRAKK